MRFLHPEFAASSGMAVLTHWADMEAPAFRSLPQDTIAILPVGAVDQHGPHLPLGMDCCRVEAVLERVLPHGADTVPALILPTLRVAKSGEHDRHPGMLNLLAETLLAVLRDMAASVAPSGVRRLVLFNAHSGNTALLLVASREARIRQSMIATACNRSAFADVKDAFDRDGYAFDLHAGENETSAMRVARRDVVDMNAAPAPDSVLPDWPADHRFICVHGAAGLPGLIIGDLSASGVVAHARSVDAARGAQLLDSPAANFTRLLAKFARFVRRVKP